MFIALVVMAFTACSSSDDLSEKGQVKELKLYAGISALKSPYNMEEWGTSINIGDIDADLAKESRFRLTDWEMTRTPADNNDWVGMSNRSIAIQAGGSVYEYTIDASGLLSATSPYYFTTLNSVNITSWYPYSENANSFSVQADQSSYANYEASDYLYGTSSAGYSTTDNSISYVHKTAKIKFNVTVTHSERLSNKNITGVTLSNVQRSASVSSGNLAANGSVGTVNMYNNVATSVSGTTSTAAFEACIIPQTSSIGYTISFGGKTYSGTITSRQYNAGYIYTIDVKLMAINVTINNHAGVDLGLPSGKIWATMNIGATADTQYGNLYAWGSIAVGGAAYDGTVISPTSDYDTARKNWGGTWRMPTDTEYQELIDNCTWTWSTYSGMNGYWVSSNVAGNTARIFFPADGCQDRNRRGSQGYYWTASCRNASPYQPWHLWFDVGKVWVGDDDEQIDERTFTCSVRAISN
ncbi:MAG: hypothetical protein K5854_06035 [Prevotella sp.]|nr:hypothetical protein [Prevotella sp.]